MGRKILRVAVQVALSVAVLWWLFHSIDRAALGSLLVQVSWFPLLGISASVLLDRAVMGYKWNLLLAARGVRIPFREVFKVYYLASFVGMFLPVSVGGDILRGLKLYRDGHAGAVVASSIVLERMLGLAAGALASTLCCVALLLGLGVHTGPLLLFSIAMLGGFVVFFLLSLNERVLAWLPFRGTLVVRKLLEFHASYSAYRRHGGTLAVFLLLSVAEQIFPVLSHWFAGLALGLNVPFWVYLATLPVVQLVARLPISFNGTGVIEALLAFVFARLALPREPAVAVGLAVEIVSALTLVPALFFRARTK